VLHDETTTAYIYVCAAVVSLWRCIHRRVL